VLFILTERYGGSISAEHDLGFDKHQHIYYCQSQKAVSLMNNIKNTVWFKGDLHVFEYNWMVLSNRVF